MKLEGISLKKLDPAIEFVKRFRFVLFLGLFAIIYIFLIISINQLTLQEPSASLVESELKTVKRLRVDEDAVNKMLQLTEENIEIKALYDEARNNPFEE